MKELKNEFKNTFDNIEVSEDIKKNMKKNIIIKYKKNQRIKKVAFSISAIFFILLVSIGGTYAEDIKNAFNTMIGKKVYNYPEDNYTSYYLTLESEVRKELNYDAKLEEIKCRSRIHYIYGDRNNCYALYSPKDINDTLGIKLLNSSEAKIHNYSLVDSHKNKDEKITYINFRMANIFQLYPNQKDYNNLDGLLVTIKASIATKYAESASGMIGRQNIYYSYWATKEEEVHKYYINNLNTTALIGEYDSTLSHYQGNTRRVVLFIYDDIAYALEVVSTGYNDKIDENIHKMLETLTY